MIIRDKNILIMGLGVNGGGLISAKFCLAQGAKVHVTDLSSEQKLQSSIKELNLYADSLGLAEPGYTLGEHKEVDFFAADLLIKNPGVALDSPYLQLCKQWTTDIALFLQYYCLNYSGQAILAVTGTKGKSSIAYALHYILKTKYANCKLGGNIGRSPLAFFLDTENEQLQEDTPIVLELSSWQLADLRAIEQNAGAKLLQAQVACISNLMQDHQNSYTSFNHYVADKQEIYRHLASPACLLLPTPSEAPFTGDFFWGDFCARDFCAKNLQRKDKQQELHYFNPSEQLPKFIDFGLWGDKKSLYWRYNNLDQLLLESKDFLLLGDASYYNFGIALYMAIQYLLLNKIQPFEYREIQQLSHNYTGVPYRMELIGKKGFAKTAELHFYNDTTATMPNAAAMALASCTSNGARCYLIAGGTDKQLDPQILLSQLQQSAEQTQVFLLEGNGTDILQQKLNSLGLPFHGPYSSLQAAFASALNCAEQEQQLWHRAYLLLSPGYASFGMFQNEFDRGRQFYQLVQKYLLD